MHITFSAYFLIDTINWQVPSCKEKYLYINSRVLARKEKNSAFSSNWYIKLRVSGCSLSHLMDSVGDQGQSARKIYNI